MSTQRRMKLGYPKGPDGKPVCRFCRGPVKPPRRNWCSDKCVQDYLIRSDSNVVRRAVLKRDKGVCAICGINAEALQDSYWRFRRGMLGVEAVRRARQKAGWPDGFRSWWEADHIKPVCQGGGECGIENYRTLCYRCHKKVTAKLAAERAAQRRQKQPQMELCL